MGVKCGSAVGLIQPFNDVFIKAVIMNLLIALINL